MHTIISGYKLIDIWIQYIIYLYIVMVTVMQKMNFTETDMYNVLVF